MELDAPFATLAATTAVVTGAARGLGLTIAASLHRVGMTVLLVDRDGDELGNATRSLGDGVVALVADLSRDDCLPALDAALASLPALTVWVNNAGRVSHQAAEDVDIDEFERVLSDNASSVLRGSQLAFRHMSGGGSIVNISSFVVEKALPQRLSYATSKAAVENVTRYTAQEWGPRGIRVNAISPGYIETRLTQWPEDDPRSVAKRATIATLPLRRAGLPEDIAHTVLYLASPLASYVTGQVIYVAGGWQVC